MTNNKTNVKPKFKEGDKVVCDFIVPKVLTVQKNYWNGFTWMYNVDAYKSPIDEDSLHEAPEHFFNL